MRVEIVRRAVTWLALGAMAGVSFIAATGCGKKADHTGLSDAVLADLRKCGDVLKSGCQDDLNDVFFISPATLPTGAAAPAHQPPRAGFAVGKNNTILRTTDGGRTWCRAVPRSADEKAPEFVAVLFGSMTDGWAVSRGVLLHTADGGENWTQASKLPGNFYYFGPSTVTPAHYYQMQPPGCGATVHRTASGGKTWEALPATLPRNDYETVFFLDDSLGWLAGNYGHFAGTQDGGRAWTVKNLPARVRVARIQFVNPTCGWLQTHYASEGGVLSTRDGGLTWQTQDTGLPGTAGIKDMQFLDEKNGFLLANVGSGKTQIARTLDGGATWKTMATLPVDLEAGCFVSATEGWAVGPKGLILRLKLAAAPR